MTDGAIIHMNKEGVPSGVLAIPTRYIHSPTGVFHIDDLNAAVDLAITFVDSLCNSL
jgi:endoglucanase